MLPTTQEHVYGHRVRLLPVTMRASDKLFECRRAGRARRDEVRREHLKVPPGAVRRDARDDRLPGLHVCDGLAARVQTFGTVIVTTRELRKAKTKESVFTPHDPILSIHPFLASL